MPTQRKIDDERVFVTSYANELRHQIWRLWKVHYSSTEETLDCLSAVVVGYLHREAGGRDLQASAGLERLLEVVAEQAVDVVDQFHQEFAFVVAL